MKLNCFTTILLTVFSSCQVVYAQQSDISEAMPLTDLEKNRAQLSDRQRSLESLIELGEQLKALASYDPELMSLLDGEIDAARIKQVVAAMATPNRNDSTQPKKTKMPSVVVRPDASHLVYAQVADPYYDLVAKAVVQPAHRAHTLLVGKPVKAEGGVWVLQDVKRQRDSDQLVVTVKVNGQIHTFEYPGA